MKQRDFLAVVFPQEPGKTYYAVVNSLLPNNVFECTFIHSGSKYRFKIFSSWMEVVRSTGAFPVGTKIDKATLFTESAGEDLSTGRKVKVTFQDAKTYYGEVTSLFPTTIRFLHSGNTYEFDTNMVAHREGGTYNGKRAFEIKPYDIGNSLFSSSGLSTLSLAIKNNFNVPVSGEFDVRIKRADTGKIVYENNFLTADDSTARDTISLPVTGSTNLIALVNFHPAVNPYVMHPISSSAIDRDMTLSGSKTFLYNASKNVHFDVTLVYQVDSVTATSSEEAVREKYLETSRNSSSTLEFNAEVEGGFSLFGIGAQITGGTGHSSTTGSEETEGGSESHGTGTSTATTFQVYSPRGFEINVLQN